jgi:peptide/nickel transport system ATP-binding protein
MGLLPANGQITAGRIQYLNVEVSSASRRVLRRLRGSDIGMVFQDPATSLNPTLRVGTQLRDALRAHHGSSWSRRAVQTAVVDALKQVGMPDPGHRVDCYPHELSGGMQQRVVIAMAVLLRPRVLVADEPTSALDVTLEAQILELLEDLRREHHTAIVLVSHDLGVIAETADRVAVMYAGRIVETGPTSVVFSSPSHPYTSALIGSFPTLGRRGRQLTAIPGGVPELSALPSGCSFHPRCPHAEAVCIERTPPLYEAGKAWARCHMLDSQSGHSDAVGYARSDGRGEQL